MTTVTKQVITWMKADYYQNLVMVLGKDQDITVVLMCFVVKFFGG
jgi:hypothetical protein